MTEQRRPRIVVAITGATGTVFGIRILEQLRALDVETHLIITRWGRRTIEHETTYSISQVTALADVVHPVSNQAATLSSGSFRVDGMLIAPCSMRTLAAISHGLADNLVTRAADVMLKERHKLVLLVRETPLNEVHLENMLKLSRMGVVIFPPVPAFYPRPATLDEVVDHTSARTLDQLGLEPAGLRRWDGQLATSTDTKDAIDR